MAKYDGSTQDGLRQSRKLTYFYLNDLLHRSLHINRGADKITTWCYPLHKRVTYTYSDVRKRREPAYTTQEVAKMLNRDRTRLELAIICGNIEAPQLTYGLNEAKRSYKYMWSEKNILEAHAYFSTVHRGRPRKDGLATPQRLPNVKELRAMIRQEELLYVKTDSGDFVPVWKAPDFD